MSTVVQVDKKVLMGQDDIIRFQFVTHCYIERISISDADLDCLTLLAKTGTQELQVFCGMVVEQDIFKSVQTVRNALAKGERLGLIVKNGKNKKQILINPALNIAVSGSILLDFKFLYRANAA
jgi:hypothetical protein